MKKEFTHQLEESFKYSHAGEFQQAEILSVTAPKSSDFYDNLQFLDSLCNKSEMRSMKNFAGILKELKLTEEEKVQAEQQNSEKSEDEKALDTYMQVLSGLEEDEIKKLNIVILELLKKSAKVDGEKNFEEVFWNDMCIEDRRLIIGKYIENFTVTAQRNSKKR